MTMTTDRVVTPGQMQPLVLEPRFVERVWGADDLAPWYDHESDMPVGEVWLAGEDSLIAEGTLQGMRLGEAVAAHAAALLGPSLAALSKPAFPLLVKLLFPTAHLSVQVHPDDELAAQMGRGAQAKSECWYALSAEPGALIALGLKSGLTSEDLHAALGHEALDDLLVHQEVAAGDMFNVPAGTVHAIGPGMVLLEVQQASDTTFRLWDYGRPRELHLEDGKRAVQLETAAARVEPQPIERGMQLIATPHFVVERYQLRAADAPLRSSTEDLPQAIVVLQGSATLLSGDTTLSYSIEVPQGRAAIIPASLQKYNVTGDCVMVCCRVPAQTLRIE